MKRIIACILSAVAVLSLLISLPSFALEDPKLTGVGSVILIHNETGRELYRTGEETDIEAGPAARLLAALIYLEEFDDLTQTVRVNRAVTGLATSTMNPGLKTGETLPVYDLLCGMLVANSEDAVYALAYALFEDNQNSPELMTLKMNTKAKELGMTSSDFVSIIGRDPKPAQDGTPLPVNTTSMSDLILLTKAAQKNETLTEICALDQYTVPATDKSGERLLYTRNYLLSPLRVPGYTYEYASGLVAEDSARAGYCVIATAAFADKSFTAIVMGATEKYGSFIDAKALFEWADASFSYRKVLDPTKIFGEIHVALSGDSDYITVASDKTIYAFLPKDADLSKSLTYIPELSFTRLTAPVYEGLIAGKVEVFFEGESLGKTDLVTTGSLALNNRHYYLALAENFLSSRQFLYICLAILLLLMIYLLINARVRYLRAHRPDALEFTEEEEPRFTPPPPKKKAQPAKEPMLTPPEATEPAQEQVQPVQDKAEEFGIDDDYLKMPSKQKEEEPSEERDDTGGFAIPTPKRTLYDGETGKQLVIEQKKEPDSDEYVPDGWNE